MRVTGSYYSQAMVSQLNTLASRQYKLQNQIATGQKLHAPEDDPAAMQRTLALRDQQQTLAQFQDNIAVLRERSMASFDQIKSLKEKSDRAGEITILAEGIRSPEELITYGNEVTQMIEEAVQLLNSQHRDQYLFAGTKTDQSPFTIVKDGSGAITAVTYNGSSNVAEADIEAGASVSVDVPGENRSGTGVRGLVADNRFGADLFSHLISLQNHLLAGDANAASTTDRLALEKDEENLIYHIGSNGTVQSRLETAASLASSQSLSLGSMISNEADADLAESIMQLNQTQTAYQAALASGAGLLRMSLMDYLR